MPHMCAFRSVNFKKLDGAVHAFNHPLSIDIDNDQITNVFVEQPSRSGAANDKGELLVLDITKCFVRRKN